MRCADDCIGGIAASQSCIPPLTPSSNQKLSQAILAIFHSFDMQQLRIPRGERAYFFFSDKSLDG